MSELNYLISKLGEDKAFEILSRYIDQEKNNKKDILTIIVNKGIHPPPVKNLRGTIFYASEGNLDFSNANSVQSEFDAILKSTAKILKSKNWNQVCIIPFGPCALSMQIKLLVYRITRIETIDVFHLGKGKYIDLEVEQRSIISSAE